MSYNLKLVESLQNLSRMASEKCRERDGIKSKISKLNKDIEDLYNTLNLLESKRCKRCLSTGFFWSKKNIFIKCKKFVSKEKKR